MAEITKRILPNWAVGAKTPVIISLYSDRHDAIAFLEGRVRDATLEEKWQLLKKEKLKS